MVSIWFRNYVLLLFALAELALKYSPFVDYFPQFYIRVLAADYLEFETCCRCCCQSPAATLLTVISKKLQVFVTLAIVLSVKLFCSNSRRSSRWVVESCIAASMEVCVAFNIACMLSFSTISLSFTSKELHLDFCLLIKKTSGDGLDNQFNCRIHCISQFFFQLNHFKFNNFLENHFYYFI